MIIKRTAIPVFLVGILLSLAVLSSAAAQEKQPEQKQRVVIPKAVKAALEAGIQTREARNDIPFTIVKNIFLPARENVHSVFLFECKNADLGYAPVVSTEAAPTQKKEEEQSSFESAPARMQTHGHAFLQFNSLDNGNPGPVLKEVYIPYHFQIDGADYKAEDVGLYSTGYPLPAGHYLLSMAVCSPALDKIGTQYFEFTLPAAASFTEALETTPIFFAKKIQRMQSVELKPEIHKEYFTYSVLQITPNLRNEFTPDDNLDIFFFIFGTKATPEGAYDIEIEFEVVQNDKVVIRYATQKYPRGPIVSQPLPLTRTVKITSTDSKGKKTEKTEQRKIDPGQYVLKISIKDNISGNSVKKAVPFEVK